MSTSQEERNIANALRFLAMDAVEKAKSGHPGAPMGMAEMASVLWRQHLSHNPNDPHWANRDRFVLSNGHASMLIYALLHLTGYPVKNSDLQSFRQLGSITAGHPEVHVTPGVETTTGPLGQGLSNAVGMALAEKLLAQHFNRPGHNIVDHRTWVFLGDGCLMEGISHEVCSLAGVWGLNKLTCFYDDNGISIDGHVEGWFRDDTAGRFRAYGWHVIGPIDGHDTAALGQAIAEAKKVQDKPVFIICRTTIGWGAPSKAGTHDVHGAPLGAEEIAACRKELGWSNAPFEVPENIRQSWDAKAAGAKRQDAWEQAFAAYRKAFPELAAEFQRRMQAELPANWAQIRGDLLQQQAAQSAPVASRKSSQHCLDMLVAAMPELLGGSADLTGSNFTNGKTSRAWHDIEQSAETGVAANYISYGVREFGMAAIMNGVTLHGGLLPYGGTFAVFSDYSRNAIRMSALMQIRTVHVLTHDSIGLGEDGPTHQPIEHASSLRLIPNLDLWRPADALETAVAWIAAIERKDGPTALMLTRQNLPPTAAAAVTAGQVQAADIARGGYVLSEPTAKPKAVIIATGSEIYLAMEAQQQLAAKGVPVRVVSLPCTRIYDQQPKDWQEKVLPTGLPRIAVEAAHPDFWRKYVGLQGDVLGIPSFGESAPAPALYKHFGITVENLVERVERLV